VFEVIAQLSALAGGVFNHRGDARGLVQGDIDGLGDAAQALVDAD
jgi:hypothetical protein